MKVSKRESQSLLSSPHIKSKFLQFSVKIPKTLLKFIQTSFIMYPKFFPNFIKYYLKFWQIRSGFP